jgi:hypothetical protein
MIAGNFHHRATEVTEFPEGTEFSVFLRILCVLCASVVISGCVERVDAPLPVDRRLAAEAGSWTAAGTFGGTAELVTTSDDPWERRFDDGTFLRLSGLDTTADEVWVCDTAISRIQVFDYDGNFQRSYGSGVPIDEVRPSDAELLRLTNASRKATNDFEQSANGQRWIGSEAEHFIAADVVVTADSYVIADQAKTGIYTSAKRAPGVVSLPLDGGRAPLRMEGVEPGWPSYVNASRDGRHFAASDPLRNALYIWEPGRETGPPVRKTNQQVTLEDVMEAMYRSSSNPLPYRMMMQRISKAGGLPGEFDGIGGVVVAFDKVVACDTNNSRLQVFEPRGDDEFYFGKVIRVIDPFTPAGKPRFVAPRDIDIDGESGRVYVLDTDRQEVVELSPTFDRLGVVARGFQGAYALDLSPDGRHLFVSDRPSGLVHHYVRSD